MHPSSPQFAVKIYQNHDGQVVNRRQYIQRISTKAAARCRVLPSFTSKEWAWSKNQLMKVCKALQLSLEPTQLWCGKLGPFLPESSSWGATKIKPKNTDGSATAGTQNSGAGMVATEGGPANSATLLRKQAHETVIISLFDEEKATMPMALEWLLPSLEAVAI